MEVDDMWDDEEDIGPYLKEETFAAPQQMASDEIKTVRCVSKDGGDYVVRCPHCCSIIGIEGDDLSDIHGEQYRHRACGGWLMVDYDARYVREL